MMNYIYATLMWQDFISKHVTNTLLQSFFSDPNGLMSAKKFGNFKQIFDNLTKSTSSLIGNILKFVGVIVSGVCFVLLVWSFMSKNNNMNKSQLIIGIIVGLVVFAGGYSIILAFADPLKQGTEDLLAGKTLE